MIITLVFFSVAFCQAQAIKWHEMKWAFNCDYTGGDIGHKKMRKVEDCGVLCFKRPNCTRFAWKNAKGGMCWLKNNNAKPFKTRNSSVCGEFKKEKDAPGSNDDTGSCSGGDHGANFTSNQIKATYWSETSDSGGCQVPQGDYRVKDALALGQQTQLGSLIWRQGLCGQVLNIDCGNGVVPAVVVSTCNLNSDTCGIDMIGKTWRKATAGKSSGIEQCKVSLTKINPLKGDEMQCYHRPNSETNNKYFSILGVLNTNGRITANGNVAGIEGNRYQDGWFMFNANGQPLFVDDAKVTFTFEDGGNVQFKFRDCRDGKSTQIFK
ncbi:uncharacterized protein LOC116346376 [Contarinia nasturtii]|uniref:uncharacterized protein LOC116346376 n=1 Tax=Contarinia nasturtii TaxID=265458 RepID=UPI0012D3EA40|nr:uncharacterized protein LOC116346376 [Contarinia nasturtii]